MATTCTSARSTPLSSCTAGEQSSRGGLPGGPGLGGCLPPSGPSQLGGCLGVSLRSSGVGRTGAFCLLYAAMQEVEAGNGIPDLPQLVKRMRQQRKHMLQEKVWGAMGKGAGAPPQGCGPLLMEGLTMFSSSSSLAAPPQVLLRSRPAAR